MEQLSIDTVKVEKLVREYLAAQSLTVFPQTLFGDAVSQFIDKDDKHAMELFIDDSLSSQIKRLLETEDLDDDNTIETIKLIQADMQRQAEAGQLKNSRKRKMKPKPADWDSDLEGSWADQPAAVVLSENEDVNSNGDANSAAGSTAPRSAPARGRGRGRANTTTNTRASAATPRATAKPTAQGKATKNKRSQDEDEDEDDVVMLDDDEEDEEPVRGSRNVSTKQTAITTSRPTLAPAKKARARAASTRQTTLGFSQSIARPSTGKKTYQEIVSSAAVLLLTCLCICQR